MNRIQPDIGFIPTPPAMVWTALAFAQIQPDDVVYDLGCGDGRVLLEAAQRFGVSGVGIDLDRDLILQAKKGAIAAKIDHLVEFRQGNLFNCDVQDATVIFVYLLPHLNLRLLPKLRRQLKPGSRIISRDFDFGDWPPDRVCPVSVGEEAAILYYWAIA